jgi:membrane-associated phospholipid phosphatase
VTDLEDARVYDDQNVITRRQDASFTGTSPSHAPGFGRRRRAFGRLLRRFAPIIAGLGLLVPLVLLGLGARHGHVFGWDTAIWKFLHGHEEAAHGSIFDRAANEVVQIGGTATLLLGLLILAALLGFRRARDGLFLVATGATILALTPLLKEQFERAELNYSFPSGHAARSAALVAAAIMIAWPTRLRWPTLILGVLFTVTLGTALVYEDWHLPYDVVGGWCLGIACAGATRIGLTTLTRRRRPQGDRLGALHRQRDRS